MENEAEQLNPEKVRIVQSLPVTNLTANKYGKLAEQVRRIEEYRSLRRLFIAPVESLLQARINGLLDQKEIIMPSAGLKEGFYILRPNMVPFKDLCHAVTFKGLAKYSEKISSAQLGSLAIDLILVGADAVDRKGGRISSGKGLTDLAVAILGAYGAINKQTSIFAVSADNRILDSGIPVDLWDIRLNGIVTPAGIEYLGPGQSEIPSIYWQDLTKKQIKKIQPLWDLVRSGKGGA